LEVNQREKRTYPQRGRETFPTGERGRKTPVLEAITVLTRGKKKPWITWLKKGRKNKVIAMCAGARFLNLGDKRKKRSQT